MNQTQLPQKAIVVYEHMAIKMKIQTTQVPLIIYDCLLLGDNYKKCRFQCLVGPNTYTIFQTKEDVLKAYPHVIF